MSDLYLRIDAHDGLAWRTPASAAWVRGRPDDGVRASATRVLVLVPNEDVSLHKVALPAASPARLARLVPWALEDRVLDEVDSLHFALGPRDSEGEHAVAVVARARVQHWLAVLDQAGLRADAMLPDCLALPLAEPAAVAWCSGGRCLLRSGLAAGWACASDQLAAWWPAGQTLQLHLAAGEATPELPPEHAWHIVRAAEPWAEPDADTINLLCGAFAPRHRQAGQRRLWRLAAVLAALAIVLGLAARLTSVVRLQAANAAVEQALQESYANLFPQAPASPDPVARVRSELQRLGAGEGGGEGMLNLLARAAPVLGSQGYRLQVRGIDYRNNNLELAVRAPDLASLDELRERLATLPGVRVTLDAASPVEGGVDGRISLAGGES